jgi:hypothetical protein
MMAGVMLRRSDAYGSSSDGDDLLGLRGQRAIGEDSLTEGIECCFDVGREGSPFLQKLRGEGGG